MSYSFLFENTVSVFLPLITYSIQLILCLTYNAVFFLIDAF